MNFKPIGYVRRGKGASRKEIVDLVVLEEYAEGLKGIEEFSHLIVLYFMHLAKEDKLARELDGVEVGVFATRSPNRPNPIGLSVVELLSVEGNVLKVRGINAFDGTPILDIKPYDEWDSVQNPRVPEWYRRTHLKEHGLCCQSHEGG
ncbi:MAG: tRNA (N6-threonylcarbamoyladenosine(37)-N6)-methyltransferase TrmO [Candidatus Aramenus sp.]|jgi:tRNA-Thr(GGU) m(6)t(6)A37 methyltransferase TsaA|nr:tRNA (N6-threonylcarbamoyladenosine(37)-N6)-methyltransferase TrmO [Candidatus Aramenus sp.]